MTLTEYGNITEAFFQYAFNNNMAEDGAGKKQAKVVQLKSLENYLKNSVPSWFDHYENYDRFKSYLMGVMGDRSNIVDKDSCTK